MDSYGKLQLCWQSGPLPVHPSQISFLSEHTLIYNAGASINLMDLNTGKTNRFGKETGPVSCLAVYQHKPWIAYAQVSVEPQLSLLDGEGGVVGRFPAGAKLEYTSLLFSDDGKYLLGTSGIPDYTMFLWNVESYELVCSIEIGAGMKVKGAAFDPQNSNHVSLITDKGELFLYKIEKCGSVCSKFTRIIIDLPNTDCPVGYQQEAITGPLTQPEAGSSLHSNLLSESEFYPYRVDPSILDTARRSRVVGQEWSTNSQLYLLTTEAILSVEGESGRLALIHRLADSHPSTSQRDRDELSHSPVRVAFPEHLLADTNTLTVSESIPSNSPLCLTITSAGIVVGFDDGSVRVLESANQFAVRQEIKLNEAPTCFLFPPDFSALAAVGESGSLFSIRLTAAQRDVRTHSTIKRHNSLSSISLIPLTDERELVVTASSDGEILTWEDTGELISTLQLGQTCTKLVGLKSAPLLLTGTSSGHMFVFSLRDPSQPKLLLTKRLHSESITELATDAYSQVVISCSRDRHLFILDARVCSEMQILCRLVMDSEVSSVSIYTPTYKDTLYIALLGGVNDVITFQFNTSWTEGDPNICYSDPSTRLLNKSTANFLVSSLEPYTLTGLCVAGPSSLYSVNRVSGELLRLVFSKGDDGVDGEEGHTAFRVEEVYNGHLVTGARFREVENACVLGSPTNEWVCTVFRDGRVLLYRVLEPEVGCLCTTVSHYTRDNILGVTFSESGQSVYCLSKWGGGVACVRLEGSETLVGRQKTQAAFAGKRMREKALGETREKELVQMETLPQIGRLEYGDIEGATTLTIKLNGVELSAETDTWLDLRNREREEEERVTFNTQREELMNGLNELRDTVLQMIERNQGLPEIEQLERTDFVLDLESQREMKHKQEESVNRKEKEIHLQNLAKLYLTEQLKDTCWETMSVTGKSVYSFNDKVEVSNYPLCKLSERARKLTQAAIDRLEIVKECSEAREDLEGDIDPSYYLKQVSHVEEKQEEDDEPVEREVDSGSPDQSKGGIDTESIEGRRAEKHGGLAVPSQFHTRSLLSYRDQVWLLQQSVEKVKQHFNQEFDEVLKLKQSEVTRSNERYARIGQIMYDLKTKHGVTASTNSDMLKLHPYEEPEKLLEVKDSEVKLERYETGVERKQREELAKIEEERILAEMGDRWRERALDMMMAGKLEIDTEDELFKDLADPDFLGVVDLTGDPELQAKKKEWEVHVMQVREEREKHRRGLESEMSKLEQGIVEGCQKVDDRIQQLYRVKIDYDKVVYQEELKVLTLLAAEMFTQELIKQEEFLLSLLERSREHKLHTSEEMTQIKQHIEKYTENYSFSQLDDKNLDRNFKREHSDLEPYVDALYKIFRKRPRVQKRPILSAPESSLSVFSMRPSSPTQALKDALEELDSFTHAPEGVESEAWERVVQVRRQKIDSELRVKKEAMDLAEMQSYSLELEREDEHAQTDTESIIKEIDRVRSVKNRLYLNIQVQLLVKQGQVEVDNAGSFLTDHSGSILIWKQTVDELNKQVKLLGKEKLDRMKQNMDFKRGIHLLEWEHRKLRMEAEDLQKKAKEIQTLKLTKEMQLRMQERDKVGDTKADMDVLERTLEHNKLAHDSKLSVLNSQLADLEREIAKRKDNNQHLDVDLQDTAVSEAERARLVERERPDPQELAKKRVRGVMLRRKMLDMAKSQAREISALRSELERLRLKTFPALLQLD